MFRFLFLFVLMMVVQEGLFAQRSAFRKSRFGSSILLGGNASQIAGDGHHGYDYPGLAIGIQGTAYFNWRFDMSVGLGYARRGAKPPLGFSVSSSSVPWQQNTYIHLDYAVLSLWLNQHLYPGRARFSRLSAHVGLLYGYAFGLNVRQNEDNFVGNDYAELIPKMSRNDFSAQLGFTYYFSPKFGFRALHSVQLIPLYRGGTVPDSVIPTLRQYHFQFGFEYIIAPDRKLLERRRTPPWVE